MNYIKNFRSFSLNESVVKADVNEIKDDINDRLMDLGSVKIDIEGLKFKVNNIFNADLNDLINCINWIISYSSSVGYDVQLSAGNLNSFISVGFFIDNCSEYKGDSELNNRVSSFLKNHTVIGRLNKFYDDLANIDQDVTKGYFLEIGLKQRKELTYMVYIDDKQWGEFSSNLPREEFEKEMQLRLLELHPLNMSDEAAEEYRSRYKNSKVTVKGGW